MLYAIFGLFTQKDLRIDGTTAAFLLQTAGIYITMWPKNELCARGVDRFQKPKVPGSAEINNSSGELRTPT
jgi:hypothetical protein